MRRCKPACLLLCQLRQKFLGAGQDIDDRFCLAQSGTQANSKDHEDGAGLTGKAKMHKMGAACKKPPKELNINTRFLLELVLRHQTKLFVGAGRHSSQRQGRRRWGRPYRQGQEAESRGGRQEVCKESRGKDSAQEAWKSCCRRKRQKEEVIQSTLIQPGASATLRMVAFPRCT